MMQKFLVIQTAFIGDVVLATALVEKLHQFYPDSKIDFLVRNGNESLLNNHPFINKVLVWNKKEHKYKNLIFLLKRLRVTRYDLVVNVQRFAATGLLTVLSGAKKTVGFDKNPFSFLYSKTVKHVMSNQAEYVHETVRNQKLIEDITDAIAAKPKLYPSNKDYEKVRQFQASAYLCVAPSSVWFTKQYPKEKWIAFINQLPSSYIIYLLGAKADIELCEEITKDTAGKKVINLAGKLSFLQSAALQQKAEMNFTNDSAPMHFASAVNAPVAAVYCSTVPSFGFGPLSDKSFIIETKEKLACKPCGLHGYNACPLGHFKCAFTIEEEQLLAVLEK